MQANPWAVAAFLAYLVVVVTIGIRAAGFSSGGVGEYFVAGRKMHRWVVALSAVASGRSAWLLLGFSGMAWKRGASALWAAVGYVVVEFFLFWFYGRRLRRFAEAHDCITLPDFFSARLGDRDGRLRVLLSVVILAFMIAYVSAQFVAGGKAFSAGFGLGPTTGVLLTAGIVLVYTVLGGFLAVSLTDLVQACFMLVALVVLPIVAVAEVGGLAETWARLQDLGPTLVDPTALGIGVLVGFLGIGLGSPGNPHILARYMSIADPEQLRVSAIVGTIWNVVMAAGALFVGLVGRVAFPEADLLPLSDTENLFPALAARTLHPLLFGLVVASIFAAIMSTADSQLLVAASSVVRDIYQKVMHRGVEMDPRRLVRLSRAVVVVLVLLALALGWIGKDVVFWLVLFAWAGLGASLGPTSILALYWRRTTRAGVGAGLVAGTVTTIVWYYTPALKSFLYELVPAFAVGLLVTWLVSLATSEPEGADAMMATMSARAAHRADGRPSTDESASSGSSNGSHPSPGRIS